MKAITDLSIRNFQSHEETHLELHSGLNVLVGPSDSGKSAVVRALRWVLYNEPLGEAFIRAGAKEAARVEATFSDDAQVARERGRSRNLYEVNGGRFEGFGADVPLEVLRAHGMPKVVIGDWRTSVHLAYQLDPAFLLHESAGTAAKVLGLLAGTEEVDLAGKQLGADLYRRRQEIKTLESRLEDLGNKLQGYAHLPDLHAAIDALQILIGMIEVARGRRQQLATFSMYRQAAKDQASAAQANIAALGWIKVADDAARALGGSAARLEALRARRDAQRLAATAIRQAGDVLAVTAGVQTAAELAQDVGDMAMNLAGLRRLREQWGVAIQAAEAAGRTLDATAALDIAADSAQSVADHIGRAQVLRQLATRKNAADTQAAAAKSAADQASAELVAASAAYEASLKEIGDCPMCGARSESWHLKEVV